MSNAVIGTLRTNASPSQFPARRWVGSERFEPHTTGRRNAVGGTRKNAGDDLKIGRRFSRWKGAAPFVN
jgi:hypothetical protein